MSIQRLQKYINLALNNSSEGEARNAASRFFKTLRSLDMRFNSKHFGLTKEQSLRLAELGGVKFKGIEPTKQAESAAKPKKEKVVLRNNKGERVSVRELCYLVFDEIDMNDSGLRRKAVDRLVTHYGLDKRSVQSYASNYRAGKWR